MIPLRRCAVAAPYMSLRYCAYTKVVNPTAKFVISLVGNLACVGDSFQGETKWYFMA
jgi:hypothetical protein